MIKERAIKRNLRPVGVHVCLRGMRLTLFHAAFITNILITETLIYQPLITTISIMIVLNSASFHSVHSDAQSNHAFTAGLTRLSPAMTGTVIPLRPVLLTHCLLAHSFNVD